MEYSSRPKQEMGSNYFNSERLSYAFCDVPKFGFYGNASIEDMDRQIRTIIEGESVRETDRFNVHFARMGEPTWNENVLAFGLALRGVVKSTGLVAKTVHPVVSTMLPKANNKLRNFLQVWCSIKNEFYNGEAGLQFSINSTDDEQSCLTLRVCHQHKFLSWLMSYQCQQAESIL